MPASPALVRVGARRAFRRKRLNLSVQLVRRARQFSRCRKGKLLHVNSFGRPMARPHPVYFQRSRWVMAMVSGLAIAGASAVIRPYGKALFQLFHHERGEIDAAVAGLAQLS